MIRCRFCEMDVAKMCVCQCGRQWMVCPDCALHFHFKDPWSYDALKEMLICDEDCMPYHLKEKTIETDDNFIRHKKYDLYSMEYMTKKKAVDVWQTYAERQQNWFWEPQLVNYFETFLPTGSCGCDAYYSRPSCHTCFTGIRLYRYLRARSRVLN